MNTETTPRKIWRVLYPVVALFVIYFALVYLGMMILSALPATAPALDDSMNRYFSIIVAVALVVVIVVEWFFYRKDAPYRVTEYIKKPVLILLVIVLGAVFSHGLNLLMSLLHIDNIGGTYDAVEAEIFAPGVVMVIIRAIILAPIAEELVFRGLVFRRMKEYTSFWPAALVSSALFGLYHMNLSQGIYAMVFGIALAAVYHRFKNLLAPMIMHCAANTLSVILEYTKASYPSTTVFIISMVVMFAISAAIWFFAFRKIPKEQ